MACIRTIKVTCTLANTAYSAAITGAGSVTAPTTNATRLKGREATFQNQTAGSVGLVGGTLDLSAGVLQQGIQIAGQYTSYTVRSQNPSGVALSDIWVQSDTAGAVIVIQLLEFV